MRFQTHDGLFIDVDPSDIEYVAVGMSGYIIHASNGKEYGLHETMRDEVIRLIRDDDFSVFNRGEYVRKSCIVSHDETKDHYTRFVFKSGIARALWPITEDQTPQERLYEFMNYPPCP